MPKAACRTNRLSSVKPDNTEADQLPDNCRNALRARGLSCAVDLNTTLYHLERQSQVAPTQRWRMNITLFNAWLHERRWAATLAALGAGPMP